jgi:hypothetical protein
MTSRGFIDMHNHMFANLGFGGRMFHGSPSGRLDQALPWVRYGARPRRRPRHHLQWGRAEPVGGLTRKFLLPGARYT